mgnify:CR=1 FL=1
MTDQLTTLEQKLVNYMKEIGYKADMEEWHFTEDMVIDGIAKEQKSGVIGSLIKKGIVESDGHPTAPAIALTELTE